MNYTEMSQTGLPILLILQLLPFVTALLLLRLHNRYLIVSFALGVSVVQIIISLSLYQQFMVLIDSNTHFVLTEQWTLWNSIQYHAGVDGMGVLFIILTAIISPLTMLYGLLRKQHKVLSFILLVEATLISQFSSLDLLWFLFMSSIEVGLILYITRRWAHDWNSEAMIKRFFHFMFIGLVLSSIGVLTLAWLYSEQQGYWSFDLLKLQQLNIPFALENIIFLLLFYGIAIRIPLFPVHGWLPEFLKEGSIAAPALFLGIKVGIFALLRFVFPLLPNAVLNWQFIIVTVAIIGIFYAAVLAIQQTNLRRALAFAVISHISIVVIAIFTLNKLGFSSGLLLTIGFGFAIAGLFWVTGIIRERMNTMRIADLSNLIANLGSAGALIGIAFVISSLTLIGMPLTLGFEGMHLMLEGSIQSFGALVAILAAVGNFLAAGFILLVIQRIFFGTTNTTTNIPNQQTETHWQEVALALSVIGLTMILGIYPNIALTLIEHTVQPLAELYTQPPLHTGH